MKLKIAIRNLFKNPFVTTVAVISLALGIGANAAIFSLFNQILLRELPVTRPDLLVNLSSPGPRQGSVSCDFIADCDFVFTYPMFRDLQREQTPFTDIAAQVFFSANLSYEKQTQSGRGLVVSGSYFPALGLQPALGRLIASSDETTPGEPHIVVLTHDYWRSRFNANPGILNQILTVNGQPMTIVGVAPAGFTGTTVGTIPQVFVPLTAVDTAIPGFKPFQDRRNYFLYLFARLKPGVSLTQAAAAINGPYHNIINSVDAPLQRMSEQTLAKFKAKELRLDPGKRGSSELQKQSRIPLTLLTGVTIFVLFIACANIANLLLARAAARSAEMAIRLSIGGSRRQLVGQLLIESCLLGALGGALSLPVAQWTLRVIGSLIPAELGGINYGVDPPTTAFAAALTLGTGILFGLFPALHSSRPDLMSELKGQTGRSSGSQGAARFRVSLATAQIALSMALLILAGLFTKSLFNVSRTELGFQTDKLITFAVSPGLNGYPSEKMVQVYERIESELSTLPGVTGITSSTVPLVGGDNSGTNVSVQGFQGGLDVDEHSMYTAIGEHYFQTLGIPLIAGREFTASDANGTPKVAIVNEKFAEKFNLGSDAVGKRMSMGRATKLDMEIVGLTRSAKYSEVKSEIPPVFFLPYRQRAPVPATNFYVRTAADPRQVLPAIQPLVARVDSNLPVEHLRTMPEQVNDNIAITRVIAILSASFASLATLLAAIGLYGVLAYTVAQRTREIGVRMALGAAPSGVRRMVLRQVLWMTLIGGTIGVGAALALGRFGESLLFQLNGRDPVVLTLAAGLLALVALGAGFIPAHRASRVDPIRALRYE